MKKSPPEITKGDFSASLVDPERLSIDDLLLLKSQNENDVLRCKTVLLFFGLPSNKFEAAQNNKTHQRWVFIYCGSGEIRTLVQIRKK